MNDQIQAEFKKIFNGRFSTSESTRANYARGEDTYDPVLSKAVVFPETNEEVSKVLRLCNEHKIPVVPFGTGTSLEGNVVGNEKGITICLEKMNKILSVNVEDFDCRVQACVTKEQLNDYLREDGVFFPIDPGANAAIGGMASTSASGTMAVKYGTMKTVITGLTVVLPNGDIIKTGSRTKKTSAGYNLTNLFIGSEGTLGIITEIQLRLSPIPESIMSAVCHFSSLEDAVRETLQIGLFWLPLQHHVEHIRHIRRHFDNHDDFVEAFQVIGFQQGACINVRTPRRCCRSRSSGSNLVVTPMKPVYRFFGRPVVIAATKVRLTRYQRNVLGLKIICAKCVIYLDGSPGL